MERDLYTDGFERLLKQKVDAYHMYPSEAAWMRIHEALHRRQRHFLLKIGGITVSLLLFIALSTSRYQHGSLLETAQLLNLTSYTQPIADKITPSRKALPSNSSVIDNGQPNSKPTLFASNPADAVTFNTNDDISYEVTPSPVPEAEALPALNSAEHNYPNMGISVTVAYEGYRATMNALAERSLNMPSFKQPASSPSTEAAQEGYDINLTDAEKNYEVRIPLPQTSQQEIAYSIVPSVSYRVLQTPTTFTFGNLTPTDPNNAVKHSPSVGWEAAISILSPLTPKIKFLSGLQLNYTSYNVTAYTSFPQMTTVRLSGFNNIQRISNLRTSGGTTVQQLLRNSTLQVAVPIGLQFRVSGNNNFSWNFTTTVQPAYLLDATGYLVSSDYNNYIKAPEFLRRFNINAGIETHLSWKKGNTTWQVGPALRYQLLSNSVSAYPIKEHLINYGFRLGLIRKF